MSVRLAARLEGFESRPIIRGIDGGFWPVPSRLLLDCGVAVLDGAGGEGALVACSTRRQPSRQVNPAYTISNRAPSTTRVQLGVGGESWWEPFGSPLGAMATMVA